MSRHLPTTRRFRVFLAVVPLSLIIAIPVLSQPLGLSDAWRDSSTQPKSQIQSTASSADPESQLDTQPLLPEPSEVRPPVDAPVETGVFFDEMGDLHDLLITRGKNPILTPKLPLTAGDDGVEEDEEEEEEDEDDAVIFEKPNGILVEQIIFEDVHYNLYITAGPLNIRSGPSKNFASLGRLSMGDKVVCTGASQEWMRIDYDGRDAYVYAEFTSKNMVFQDIKQTVYVDVSTLNLRKGPSTDTAVITKLSRHTRLTRTGIGDGWSRVKTSSGQVGYVYSEYLTRKEPPTAAGTTYSGSRGTVVDLAMKAKGVRYVFGGASMSGFDCSGLVYWIYRQIGITLPRTSYGYGKVGSSVSYSNMKPGDIICIDHRKDGVTSITHLGIYIGNGYMMHASSSNRKMVQVRVSAYMSRNPKYKLVTIRRVLK